MIADPNREGFAELGFLVRAFQLSKMLQVAAALEIADRVEDGPKPVAALARDCGADLNMLLRLCRALAAFGVFVVDAEGNIGHSPRSEWLRKSAKPTLHYAALYWTTFGNWTAWAQLEHAVRTGACPFEEVFGKPNFSYLAEHPDEAALFDQFMQHSPDDRHSAVVDAYDFTAMRLVVDVGGGNGALLKSVLTATSQTKGLLYDQQAVVAAAPTLLNDPSLEARCRVVAGDFFQSVPPGGDCYTLSQILHDWSDERCRAILRNCRMAMSPEARLLVIERVLDEQPGQTNPANFLADMQMMVLFPGARERTVGEFADLLQETGFQQTQVIPTRSPFCIIEACPDPARLDTLS